MNPPPTITNYLGNGGLFNPEYMEHDKVRAMLIEIRDALIFARDTAGRVSMNGKETWHLTAEATQRLEDRI